MLHIRCRLCRDEVFARTLKEIEHGGGLPGRRVGDVDNDIGARQCGCEAFTSPVTAFTPDFGEAATASWPCALRLATSFDPINPVPPITTIFMACLLSILRA
jgi:hypothetical protein